MGLTRTVTEHQVFLLILNPCMSRAEDRQIAIASTEREKLVEYFNSSKLAEPYKDESGVYRTFDIGFLRNFNDTNIDEISTFGHGIFEEWIPERDLNNLTLML